MKIPEEEMALLLKKIKSLQKTMKLPLTASSSNYDVEHDLAGKNLEDLDKETLTLVAYDVPVLNDEAFRYYIFQFIELVLTEKNPFCADSFISALFEVDTFLNRNSKRYLQFNSTEVGIILEYLKCILKNINFTKPGANEEDLDGFSEFEDWKKDVIEAIIFWKQHPNYEGNSW